MGRADCFSTLFSFFCSSSVIFHFFLPHLSPLNIQSFTPLALLFALISPSLQLTGTFLLLLRVCV